MCQFCKNEHPQPRTEPRWAERERERREREKQRAALEKRARAVSGNDTKRNGRLSRNEDPRPNVLGFALISADEYGVCARESDLRDAVNRASSRDGDTEIWEHRIGPEGRESARLLCVVTGNYTHRNDQ